MTMIYYVTKYWEARGIEVVNCEPASSGDDRFVYQRSPGGGLLTQYQLGKTAFVSFKEACTEVRKQLEKKKVRLRKKLLELESQQYIDGLFREVRETMLKEKGSR
jgi:hypothetical protein